MKKIVTTVFVLMILLVFSTSIAYAQTGITECPNVKIVIDGKITVYKDVPLTFNGRTVLPLRDILVNLGVQNDDSHIIWNAAEKSVTIIKDSTKIYLKQGSTTAYVNDSPVTLDVSPLNYEKNSRMYIPARFVAQALGKKVIWDGSTKTVLIRDVKDFDNVKGILQKVNDAEKTVTKAKFNVDTKVSMDMGGKDFNTIVTGGGEFDKDKKLMHMVMDMSLPAGMPAQKMSIEYYFMNDAAYMLNPLTKDWQKIPLPKELTSKMFENNYNAQVDVTDSMCAGLTVEDGTNPDEFVLKGNVYLDSLFQTLNSQMNTNLNT